jgi:membrane associated rhomboid family serine protease
MGIYDREYYRREGPSLLSTFSGRGQMCKWLIGINVACFLVQLVTKQDIPGVHGSGPGIFTSALLLDTQAVLHGQVWRLLTYAFLHDPSIWQHIVFNMWFLWMFGTDVEDIYGPREFLAVYLVSAVIGGMAFVLTNLAPGAGGGVCLGASGAVTAVMVLCALHYPRKVILLFFILPIPIWLFVGFNVVQDAFIFVGRERTQVAVAVHLGGALFAFTYYKRHWRLSPSITRIQQWFKQRNRPALRVYREEPPQPVHASAPPSSEADEHLEAKLDRVLEKVASHGQSSLTEGERQVLMRASEIYRKRRN